MGKMSKNRIFLCLLARPVYIRLDTVRFYQLKWSILWCLKFKKFWDRKFNVVKKNQPNN